MNHFLKLSQSLLSLQEDLAWGVQNAARQVIISGPRGP